MTKLNYGILMTALATFAYATYSQRKAAVPDTGVRDALADPGMAQAWMADAAYHGLGTDEAVSLIQNGRLTVH
jgi:hypothetical protein